MIWLVPTEQVAKVWPDAEPWLRPVTDLPACRSTLRGTLDALRSGDKQLFVAIEQGTVVGAITTKVMSYDTGDWLCVVLCGGRGLDEHGEDAFGAIEGWAKQCGCVGVEIIGRDGWAKAFGAHGYERTGSMIQKALQ